VNPIALQLHEAALTLDGAANVPEIVALIEIAEGEINRLDELSGKLDELARKLDDRLAVEIETIRKLSSHRDSLVIQNATMEADLNRMREDHFDPKSRVSWKIVAQEMISRCDLLMIQIEQHQQPHRLIKAIDYLINRYKGWRWRKKHQPCVTIDYGGTATPNPMVHVGAFGHGGSQGVYSWKLDDQGNACASLYGRGLAEIFDVPLIDRRDPKWPRTN
jgi:hypothetical protein